MSQINLFLQNLQFFRKNNELFWKNVDLSSVNSISQAKSDKHDTTKVSANVFEVYTWKYFIFMELDFFQDSTLKGPYFENKNWRVNIWSFLS